MSEDISRKTILVLVVLTVIVSALGTLTVLDTVGQRQFTTVPTPAPDQSNSAQGQVTLNIVQPPPSVTGKVTLDLITQN